MEPLPTSRPIRAVARGLGPAIAAAALVAIGLARFEVERDETEFAQLRAAAAAAGSPGGLPARPTAAMSFWRVGNPDKDPGKDGARESAGDEAATSLQAQVRKCARALHESADESGHDVSAWLPSRGDMDAIASCTSAQSALCASIVKQLRQGCANEQVECTLLP